MIDLRSDTVTKPSKDMRLAMFNAEVGDDVFGEDPTTNDFQREVAGVFGKEAGLFVPTGVMSNQLAIRAQTSPGDEVIVDAESHIFHYESAGPSILSSVQLHTVRSESGCITPEQLDAAIRPNDYHMPPTRLLCLENTHNRLGGAVVPFDELKAVSDRARERGIRIHLDGARIWNASIASNVSLFEYGNLFDSVSVCFSKGLGAPVGSMLLADADTITRAHRFRKVFGGGMRQIGVITAAARFAVHNNIARLADDHKKAAAFKKKLSEIGELIFLPEGTPTNMCIFDIRGLTPRPVDEILTLLHKRGVQLTPSGSGQIRAVTHQNVSIEQVLEAATVIRDLLKKMRAGSV
jgi:threonine aldolase